MDPLAARREVAVEAVRGIRIRMNATSPAVAAGRMTLGMGQRIYEWRGVNEPVRLLLEPGLTIRVECHKSTEKT